MRTRTDLERLDDDIAAAWITLGVARRAWARSPNAETVDHEQRCERYLNGLLELRYTVQTRPC